jgi:hypothetical protein
LAAGQVQRAWGLKREAEEDVDGDEHAIKRERVE